MGNLYVGNSSGKAAVPKKIYAGNSSGVAAAVKVVYVGNSSGKAVEVWRTSTLPSTYQKVEYIYNTGRTQYIDTGLYPNINTTAEVEVSLPSIYNDTEIFGSVNEASGDHYYRLCTHYGSGKSKFYYIFGGGNYDSDALDQALQANTKYKVIFNAPGGYFYVDDTLLHTSTRTWTVSSCPTLTLFANHRDSHFDLSDDLYIYHFAAKQSNKYVRDMYPCYRKSDNVIGMYDLINSKFYTNAGSGIFYKGPDVD